MSNRRKTMRTKLPKPTQEQGQQVLAALLERGDVESVPAHLSRRQLRAMRRRVPVMQVLQPALDWAAKQPTHVHTADCAKKES